MPVAKFFAAVIGAFAVAALLVRSVPFPKTGVFYRSVQRDLENLVSAQEHFFLDSARYARTVEELGEDYGTSFGVSVQITQASDSAFAAQGKHEQLLDVSCYIEVPIAQTREAALTAKPSCSPSFKYRTWVFVWQ